MSVGGPTSNLRVSAKGMLARILKNEVGAPTDLSKPEVKQILGFSQSPGQPLEVLVCIGKRSHRALVDTGATTSLISKELAEELVEEGWALDRKQTKDLFWQIDLMCLLQVN